MNSHGASLRISTEKYSFGIAKLLDFSPHDAGDAFNLCAPLLQIDLIVVGLHVGCIILREVLVPEVIPVLIYRAVREDDLIPRTLLKLRRSASFATRASNPANSSAS
eukprot:CAMPEP_0180428276 /NCGR_PEP_ID=MMETSP1036_2-20121128/6751_1 /TAXON_ID=632150 /ORGANISM="Azadinium spinosum, Strain 3D9" /LENGTH=106 /DNA_ID=CAMNT_0022433903 /DNA_START=346 /DNA_END=670 /DNA_ORIENTATION=-